VIRNQSTESLPFPMIFMGTFVGFSWLLYGIILNNGFMIVSFFWMEICRLSNFYSFQAQTSVACVLACGQLSLFVIYPSKSKIGDEKKKD
jgi:solute carrier family 50 protein (sugar transporter)